MDDMKLIGSSKELEFYEILRYFLPGILFVFLFSYLIFPIYVKRFSFAEKLIFGILIGFILHSFTMYKWVPSSSKIREQYSTRINKLLEEVDDFYLKRDLVELTMSTTERRYFRRYLGLGAFKLDIVFVLIIFGISYAFKTIFARNTINIIFLLFILITIYIVRDDGLNDLRRAFNINLLLISKYKSEGELEKKVKIIKENEEFITNKRKFENPTKKVKDFLCNVNDDDKNN